MNEEINTINSYLRVNNMEVVGLRAPNEGELDEDVLFECLDPLVSNDISICNEVPSRRSDNKE